MSEYKISVIVATYNTGDYLNEFLDSIKVQSIGFENVEVIFVDDKSTDEYTLNLLKAMESNSLARRLRNRSVKDRRIVSILFRALTRAQNSFI